MKAAQVVDVVSGVTRAAAVTTVLRGQDVVLLLESLRERERDLPLVLAHDGGSENVNQDVQAWARRHRVVLLRSVPHTPQHNPWVERKHGEVRAVSALRANTVLASVDDAAGRFADAVRTLDQHRLRPVHGLRTAAVRDREGRVSYSPAQREATWQAARTAQRLARWRCARPKDRPRAQREATLRVLEEFGVFFRTRGGARIGRASWKSFRVSYNRVSIWVCEQRVHMELDFSDSWLRYALGSCRAFWMFSRCLGVRR